MTKSPIIDLGLGNLEQDTPVRVKLWWNSEQKRADEYNTNLPPDTILSRLYKIWQKLYNIRYQTVSSRSSVTLLTKKPIPTYIRRCPQWNFDDLWQNIDNLSNDLNDNNLLQQLDDFISLDAGLLDLCENISSSDINKNLGLAQQKLEERFNIWLQYQEFINCQHQWDKNGFLNINDEIFVIFQIQDHLIRKLPWHQWNFFDKYPLATHAFGSLSYQGRFVSSKSSNQVEILAVLCDDEGIDLQQERIIFNQLVNDLDVKIDFIPFPFNRKHLEERLEKGCYILFFAGHSKTQSESGHIYINDQERSISKLQQVNKYLQSLKKKIPLEKIVETSTDKPKFTLQPVIIEYITKRLINQIVDEIRDNQIELFNTHALFKAQGKEYIKDIQIRLILKPIIEQLLPKSEFRNIDNNLNQLSKNIPQNHLELIEKIRSEIFH